MRKNLCPAPYLPSAGLIPSRYAPGDQKILRPEAFRNRGLDGTGLVVVTPVPGFSSTTAFKVCIR